MPSQVMSKYLLRQTQNEKARVKSADRTEKETHELLEAWAPKFSKLWGVSQRKKSKSGTISILRIKKGVQKARKCYSR